MSRHALPDLHTLLRVGKKMLNLFWDFTQDRIKVLPEMLVENLNIPMVAHMTVVKSDAELERLSASLKDSVGENISTSITKMN